MGETAAGLSGVLHAHRGVQSTIRESTAPCVGTDRFDTSLAGDFLGCMGPRNNLGLRLASHAVALGETVAKHTAHGERRRAAPPGTRIRCPAKRRVRGADSLADSYRGHISGRGTWRVR